MKIIMQVKIVEIRLYHNFNTFAIICILVQNKKGFPGGSAKRIRLPMQEMWVQSLDWEDSLEKEMATHSSNLIWKIPWTEEPGQLQSMGSQRVRHD